MCIRDRSNSSGIRNVGKEDGSYFRIRTEKGTMTIEKKKLRYVPAKDLVKIARAGNRQAVRRTISGIQAQINQLKSCLLYTSWNHGIYGILE